MSRESPRSAKPPHGNETKAPEESLAIPRADVAVHGLSVGLVLLLFGVLGFLSLLLVFFFFGFDFAERDLVAVPAVDAAIEVEVDAQALQAPLVVDFPLVRLAVAVGVALGARQLAADVELHFFGLTVAALVELHLGDAAARE